jgi:hypothetical protein
VCLCVFVFSFYQNQYLEVFSKIVDLLQGEKYPTLAHVSYVMTKLIQELSGTAPSAGSLKGMPYAYMPPAVVELHQFILPGLKDKWQPNAPLNLMASIVNPNFKSVKWLPGTDRTEAIRLLKDEMVCVQRTQVRIQDRLVNEAPLPPVGAASPPRPITPPSCDLRSLFDMTDILDEKGPLSQVSLHCFCFSLLGTQMSITSLYLGHAIFEFFCFNFRIKLWKSK